MMATTKYHHLLCTVLTAFALLCGTQGRAQVHPADGAALHYRIIGFRDNALSVNEQHTLLISADTSGQADSFNRHILVRKTFTGNRVVAEVPAFGRKYTWRMVATGAITGRIHQFNVLYSVFTDTLLCRMRVTRPATRFADGYFFNDGALALYNMKGEPVWFVPSLDSGEYPNVSIRDLKMSPRHTITLLYRDMPYEIDWEGNVLWKGPNTGAVSGDTAERYHHEFTITPQGRYMVLGNERQRPGKPGQGVLLFGTVIEYDSTGKVKWSWRSSTYYENTNYAYNRGAPDYYDIHQNSFYFDEQRQRFFVSYKNISQVVEVAYPSGRVVHMYGRNFEAPGTPSAFYEQHSVKVDGQGNLLLFNNNNRDGQPNNFHPQVGLYSTVGTHRGQLLWAYEWKPTDRNNLLRMPRTLTNGGNVEEVASNCYFVSMCTPFYGMFIVGRDKKLYWSAYGQKYYAADALWNYNFQYRASLVPTRAALEQLIWAK
ncbi:MAG: hypothetical protein EBZ77_07515 [Chitinophagia bacterium]|nr:hypothetical protein [Chitinophagia bacterium]